MTNPTSETTVASFEGEVIPPQPVKGATEIVEAAEAQHEAESNTSMTLWRTNDPGAIVERAKAVADPLAKIIRERKLTSNISGKEYVRCEGWQIVGTMLGLFPQTEWTRPREDGSGYDARVIVTNLQGVTLGAAEATCCRGEKLWSKRDDYAIKAMAQTRAVCRALRQLLGFVVQLSGYEPTPAEEMVYDSGRDVNIDTSTEVYTGIDGDVPKCPNFGDWPGAPIDEVPMEALSFYGQAIQKSLDNPAKAKYRDRNMAMLATLRNEYKRRVEMKKKEIKEDPDAGSEQKEG